MCGQPLSPADLLDLLTGLEHHPDNAAPAIYGGFAVSGTVGKEVRCLRYPIRRTVHFVTLVPHFEVSTEEARRLVPEFYTKSDTVHNLNRVGLISAAFARGRYDMLQGVFDGRVHQPYREALIPQLSRVIRAGEKAGAIGGWLSGSGSTMICMTLEKPDAVARAMQEVLRESDVKLLRADNSGYKVIKKE
jgi:homoserine kinase